MEWSWTSRSQWTIMGTLTRRTRPEKSISLSNNRFVIQRYFSTTKPLEVQNDLNKWFNNKITFWVTKLWIKFDHRPSNSKLRKSLSFHVVWSLMRFLSLSALVTEVISSNENVDWRCPFDFLRIMRDIYPISFFCYKYVWLWLSFCAKISHYL